MTFKLIEGGKAKREKKQRLLVCPKCNGQIFTEARGAIVDTGERPLKGGVHFLVCVNCLTSGEVTTI